MQTDELRAELAQLAREVDEFPDDLPRIRRRVARRRIATTSVAVALTVAILAGAVALTRSGAQQVQVAHSVKEVEIDQVVPFHAAVILPDGATDDDVAHVQAVLDRNDAVAKYATLPAGILAYN